MAFPKILVNSATGSDSAASGAGPATALFGSNGTTRSNPAELQVGFFEVSPPDLSGVATDGSAVLYLAATGGVRRFNAITAKKNTQTVDAGIAVTNGSAVAADTASANYTAGDLCKLTDGTTTLYSTVASISAGVSVTFADNWTGSTGNVTITNPRQVSLNSGQGTNAGGSLFAWAIGGVRASIGSASSSLLFNNNATSADAMPGWTVEMQSGHAETIAGPLRFYRGGSSAGAITLQGTFGAATLPIVTFNNNSLGFYSPGFAFFVFKDFEVRNSNATKTGSQAFNITSPVTIRRIKCDAATGSNFLNFCTIAASGASGDPEYVTVICDCKIANTTGAGAVISQSFNTVIAYIDNCDFKACGASGIVTSGSNAAYLLTVTNCLFWSMTGRAIYDNCPSPTQCGWFIENNTIDGSSLSGIEIANASTTNSVIVRIKNNQLTNNGAYGIKTSVAAGLQNQWDIDRNNTYNNTSGAYNGLAVTPTNDPAVNPSYTASGSGNFVPTASGVKGVGYPQTIGTYGATTSAPTIGVAQAAGGSTVIVIEEE